MSRLLPERLEVLDYWITERERMRRKHDAGAPQPWTRDPLMAGARWCNVRRSDDRVSRWLLKRWYVGDRAKLANAMGAATLARYINWPDTLTELLGIAWADWDAIKARLQAREVRREKVFTGAYKVPCGGRYETRTKVEFVVDLVTEVHESRFFAINPRSMRETWAALCEVAGVGPFMAGQIVADLRQVVPGAWADRTWWAPMGPGSEKGMLWLLGRDAGSLSQAEFERRLPAVCEHVRRELPEVWRDRKLEAHDIQNCLCELSKLVRLRGGGKAKNSYTPRREVTA